MARPAAISEQQQSETSPIRVPSVAPSLPLKGPRLCIRLLRRSDLDKRQSWPPFNDPLHLIWDMPRCSQQENDAWFAMMTYERRRMAYGVDDLDGRLIGMLSLRDISWRRSARLGIALSSEYVGRGYGTETLNLFLPYFFTALTFQKMVLDVAAANVRAVRCYRKAGFQRSDSYWRPVDGPVEPELFESPEYAPLRPFFRWRWGRAETLYYDMDLRREDWAKRGRAG